MQNKLKNLFSVPFLFILTVGLMYCSKQDALAPIEETSAQQLYVSFKQDTLPVTFSNTAARKENVGSLFTTAIEGKFPDSTVRKTNLIIRVIGDSASAYNNTEILAGYTDSLGVMYANTITDTINKVRITKMEKKKNGVVEGSFTIRVSNSTKTKTYLLNEGKFSSTFSDY
jgi:hypothetical protein